MEPKTLLNTAWTLGCYELVSHLLEMMITVAGETTSK